MLECTGNEVAGQTMFEIARPGAEIVMLGKTNVNKKEAPQSCAPPEVISNSPGRSGDRRGEASYSAAIRGAAASSAAEMRGGDSGRSVMRKLIERATALATVARGGTIGTSPTPRTP